MHQIQNFKKTLTLLTPVFKLHKYDYHFQ